MVYPSLQEILLNLDDKDLEKACRTNKSAAEICRDASFWNLRIQKIYKVDLSKYKGKDTYRKIYNKLRKAEKNEDDILVMQTDIKYIRKGIDKLIEKEN